MNTPSEQKPSPTSIPTPGPGQNNSEPQFNIPEPLPGADEVKSKWAQRVGAARIAWGKLTEDELMKLEGHEHNLVGLVKERYAITRDEAARQVRAFFEKNPL